MTRRWVYTQGGEPLPEPIEVGGDWREVGREGGHRSEAEVYGDVGAVATGEPIDSRKKMREYMKREGVAHASDYSPQHYEKKQAERAKAFTPGSGYDKSRREKAIRTAVEKLRGQGKLKSR